MTGILTFEGFELDGQRFELRRDGQRVEVQPKVLRLLLHLVQNRERSVSKPELLEQLWPGESVTAASIKRAIGGARRALGQRGDSEAVIRTVRGHGYQFMLAARELPATAPALDGVAEPLFVGREEVLARLDALLGDALAGRGRSVLIAGEPGIGKTRVLQELARRAAALGASAYVGRCMEVEGAPALWPVLQILRAAADTLGPAELQARMGEGAADIAEALPELRRWLPDLPAAPRLDSNAARFRFFESMAAFLRSAAERRPIVLLLDDLQRADTASLRLLSFLIAQLDDAPVLLVGSMRRGPAREPELLRTLLRTASAPCIELTGFRSDEVARYLALRAGAPPPADVVERVHELTGGNALFVEQVVHCLTTRGEGGAAWADLASALPAPDLQGAIERHLESLAEPSQRLLRAAAVLGREFSLRLLAEQVEQPAPQVLAELEAALALGVVRSVPDSLGQYRFAHALIREALYARLPLAERARLHGRAGRLLEASEASGAPAQLSQIAEHFALAAPTDDGGRALDCAVRAARAAAACLSPEQAAAHFDRALQLLELSEPDARARMNLLLEKGEALAGAADAGARAALLDAARIASDLGADDVVLRAALAIGRVRETGSVDPFAVDLLRRALGMLADADPRWPVLQALLAKSLTYGRSNERRARDALQALTGARKLADPSARGEALEACLYALPEPEWLPQRIEIGRELEAAGHERGDHRLLRFAATAQVWSAVERGDMRAADAAIDTLDSIVRQVRDPFARWEAALFRTMRALTEGPLEVAAQRAESARELGAKLSPVSADHIYALQRNAVLRLDGRTQEAEKLVRDISMRHPALPGWQVELAAHEAQLGRLERGRALLQRMLDDDLALLRREAFFLSALASAVELCMQAGEAADAQRLYDALLPYEDRHANVSFGVATHGPLARHLGRLALKLGNASTSERHMKRALESAEAMPSTTYTSIACLSYANMLVTAGGARAHVRATALLRRSLALARRAGLRGIEQLGLAVAKQGNVSVEPQREVTS